MAGMRFIDIHSHPGQWLGDHASADGEELIELQRSCGFLATTFSSTAAMMGEVMTGNADTVALAEKYPDAYALLLPNPMFWDESMEVLRRWGNHEKVVGIKIHPRFAKQPITSSPYFRLFEEIEKLGLPVCTHSVGTQIPEPISGFCTIPMIQEVAETFPNTTFVAYHLGIHDHLLAGAEAVEACRTGNLFLDTATPELAFRGLLESVVSLCSADRVLFGSDSPIHDPKAMRFAIEHSNLSNDQKERIAHKNALRVMPRLRAHLEKSGVLGTATAT